MAAGKIQKFDPKAFDRMRGDIKQQQDQQKRIAARAPVAPVKTAPDAMKLTEKDVFGLGSRKKMANRMQKEMK